MRTWGASSLMRLLEHGTVLAINYFVCHVLPVGTGLWHLVSLQVRRHLCLMHEHRLGWLALPIIMSSPEARLCNIG